MVSVEGKVKEE
jgi:hypothetical protein